MTDQYKPTPEQVIHLAAAEADIYVGDYDRHATERFVKHPAFQAIIRAAQKEAWDKGAFWRDSNLLPSLWDIQQANPYRGSADV